MYFKIEKSGCIEYNGLVQVRYDLFLDKGNYKHHVHYIEVPTIPEEEYPGEINEHGSPIDLEDYNKWISKVPKKWQNNPFCCHFCQFEPGVTDEEILFVGELALDMAYKNWKLDNLNLNKNMPITFSSDSEIINKCEKRVEKIKVTDFSNIENIETYNVRKD